MMKTLVLTRNKSFHWSLGIHAGILLLGFLPIMHRALQKESVEYIVEVDYVEIPEVKSAGSEGLQARSPVYNEEPEPTFEQPMEEPVPVEDTAPEEVTMIEETNAEVVSDVTTMEAETDVAASESTADGSDTETHADGGGHGSPIEGNQDGAAMAGDGGAGDGLEGDGIITRRIIYREDITRVAKQTGKVVLNICIDRQGKVVYAAYDPEKTTITDKEIIKQATHIGARYRFASSHSAPPRECGQLTFIFTIDEDI
jgi:hypothetical protein